MTNAKSNRNDASDPAAIAIAWITAHAPKSCGVYSRNSTGTRASVSACERNGPIPDEKRLCNKPPFDIRICNSLTFNKAANEVHDGALLIGRDFRENGQRQNAALLPIGIGKLLRAMSEAAIGRKKGQCGRIVDCGLHTIGAEKSRQLIAPRMLYGIEMVHMLPARGDAGHLNVLDLVQTRIKNSSSSLARPRPLGEMW
jgi:hypothetical protein